MYEDLVKRLRELHPEEFGNAWDFAFACQQAMHEAADDIEELLKAAKAMHTWIFLNSGDEQAAYDECGLTDEMNAALGYGGKFILESPKEKES